ncbi:hypothetical protein QZH41_004280 [Actinostola sp. cb2023]|nr:hypothetical protein QZH41_004280 [Actinostola sp. cb2023]
MQFHIWKRNSIFGNEIPYLFCPLKETFRKKLAKLLFEQDENKVTHTVSPSRIRFVNVEGRCAAFADDSENAVVEFYVTDKEGSKADVKLTNKAYEILDNYVKNDRMAELDPKFAGKVKSLQIKGTEAPTARRSLLFTENERLLMGIAAAVGVILFIVLIFVCKAAVKKARTRGRGLTDLSVDSEHSQAPQDHIDSSAETKVEIRPPPSYDSEFPETSKDVGDNDDDENKCPLAESERSSIDELELDRPTEGVSAANPAFVHEEDETKQEQTDAKTKSEDNQQNALPQDEQPKTDQLKKDVETEELKQEGEDNKIEDKKEIENKKEEVGGEKDDEDEKQDQMQAAAVNLGYENREEPEEPDSSLLKIIFGLFPRYSTIQHVCTMAFITLLLLYSTLLLQIPSKVEASSDSPDLYIRVTFNFAWSQFCYMSELFKHSLSDILIEQRNGLIYLVPSSRIKLVNFDKECVSIHGNVKKAAVDFYITTKPDGKVLDRSMTELAFAMLYDFEDAKRMVLLGPMFERKVDKVELLGKEAHALPKTLNEAERIGIGVSVGLVVSFIVVVFYLMLVSINYLT